ncbi:MAG: type IX secretion system sortase PorU [Salinivirgaceae bacterium]|nr:type IX secretion system sortase PorU [Salinivirgaceae bacterium]
MNRYYLILVLFLLFSPFIKGQNSVDTKKIISEVELNKTLADVIVSNKVEVDDNAVITNVKFETIEFEAISPSQLSNIKDLSSLSTDIKLNFNASTERKKQYANYWFKPFRINPVTNEYEIVSKYTIAISKTPKAVTPLKASYSSNSLLASGNWYKIKINNSGVYKLSYQKIKDIGIGNPENIRIYSYGGKQLPYSNSLDNYDDLNEIPIKMDLGNDGSFNSDDYILFYAEGPLVWEYDKANNMFMNKYHYYSNDIYLFVTSDLGKGLRIAGVDNNNLTPTYSTTSFDSYLCHEIDKYNLIKTGRTWYGEKFRPGENIELNFNFPNLLTEEKIKIRSNVAGHREAGSPLSYFSFIKDNSSIGSINITGVYGNHTYAYEYSKTFEINSSSTNINLNISFKLGNSSTEGYLNYVCLNAREKLALKNGQLLFRDKNSVSENSIAQFTLENSSNPITVWDITNPVYPIEISTTSNSEGVKFKSQSDTLKEFVAFNGSSYLTPTISGSDLGKVENQNLHGIGLYDMIIVTHPKFLTYANELAQIHRDKDGLSVYVATPSVIYNEFSSGTPDISAIRNFMRMLYSRSSNEDDMLKYLLLFGDGSYDNKTASGSNSNYIPTYQSEESLISTTSYVSDDFYGLLDFNEGGATGSLDIGIGRFPVQTAEQAQLMIDKINIYMSPESMGDWKTRICFIGDDADSGRHMLDADEIARDVNTNHPEYNVNKIYLDAYQQISTPAGQRAPDVTTAINEQIEQGAFIIDYVGHGNPRILAHEEILSTNDVKNWNNKNTLPIFVTASCEVGRFDDYEITSFGEWLLLSENGGGIAALTTTRVVYSGQNHDLNTNFFNTVFDPNLRLGDIIRIAKVKTSGTNKRNFSLLGDPALKLAIPANTINISQINNNYNISQNESESQEIDLSPLKIKFVIDTLNALEKANIKGYITDSDDNIVGENGELYISVFDKAKTLSTYGLDNGVINFELQNSILYKGKASITQGFFDFDFIIPKDINYSFGNGKISLYAAIESYEAIGQTSDIIIGGNNENAGIDYYGPDIELFLNDTLFTNGGTANENPILIAHIKDENGINTTGNGFGHNITLLLDNNQDNIFNLNSFYTGDLNKYNQGKINYPLSNITTGDHTLTLKVWDIYNNSSTAEISFTVHDKNEISINNLRNNPNPVGEQTSFIFEHNQANQTFKVKISVFDIMGNEVTTIEQDFYQAGFQSEPIYWNGTSNNGAKLANGVYIYTAVMELENGQKTTKSSKLMIFR